MKYVALVLDDEPQSLSILKSVLRSLDFEIVSVTNTRDADDKIELYLPHLLIVDIGLKGERSGLDWLDSLRSGPFGHIPVIVVTSSGRVRDVHRAIRLGADDYLIKPANPGLLMKRVLGILGRRMKNLFSVSRSECPQLHAQIEQSAEIIGISETGVCIRSKAIDFSAIEDLTYRTRLFDKIGVNTPKLRFTNSGRELSSSSVGTMGQNVSRHYFQIQGWTESERKVLRSWLLSNQMQTQGDL